MVVEEARPASPMEAMLNDVGRYTPSRIAHRVIYWDELTALAERVGSINVSDEPVSSSHLFADPLRWADIQADILAAFASLGIGTPAYTLVELVMIGRWELTCAGFARPRDWESYVVREAGRLMRPAMSPGKAGLAFAAAMRLMARHLGWQPAGEEEEFGS